MRDLPDPLPRWRRSYDGEVDLSAYPEAFIGDLRGEKREPRIVVLGLNPGIAYPELQGFEGVWTCAARKDTYSRSSKHRVPFENGDWRKLHNGKDSRYFVNLVASRKVGSGTKRPSSPTFSTWKCSRSIPKKRHATSARLTTS